MIVGDKVRVLTREEAELLPDYYDLGEDLFKVNDVGIFFKMRIILGEISTIRKVTTNGYLVTGVGDIYPFPPEMLKRIRDNWWDKV